MDCKNAQSVIDTPDTRGLGNAEFSAHLDRCNDCRLYSGESATLLGLLAAQPVIEAPADFDFRLRARLARAPRAEDAITTKTIEKDNAALVSLLGAQPIISAPADFDFKLRARLARAEDAITKKPIKEDNAALVSLLGAQPIISAPADFDFKLRARLAREKAGHRSFVFGWGGWGQAVAATATLAVVVTVSALHFANSGRESRSVSPETNRQLTEKNIAQDPGAGANATVAVVDKPAIARKVRYRNPKYYEYISAAPDERMKSLTAGEELEKTVDHALNKSVDNAVIDEMWRGFDPEKGEIITARNRDLIGAEKSATTISKTLAYVPSI